VSWVSVDLNLILGMLISFFAKIDCFEKIDFFSIIEFGAGISLCAACRAPRGVHVGGRPLAPISLISTPYCVHCTRELQCQPNGELHASSDETAPHGSS